MAGETPITLIGNLTEEPDIRTLPSGATVANFTIASNERRYNSQTRQWENVSTLYMRCNAWNGNNRPLADNIQATLHKGMRVIATGRLEQSSYTDKNGNKRTVVQVTVDEIGPALSNNVAQVSRNPQNNQQGYQQPNNGYQSNAGTGYQQNYQQPQPGIYPGSGVPPTA